MRICTPLALACAAWSSSLTSGCATARREFMPDTHAPITVYDRVETHSGVRSVATGSAQTVNGNGEVVGTTTFYQNRVVRWKERNWYPLQGQERLDDESFYRIAGDQDAVKLYADYHESGVTKHKIGWGLLGGGIALLGGGIAMAVVARDGDDRGLSYGGYLTMAIGLAAGGVGGWLAVAGKRQAEITDHRLVEDARRMKADAEHYNLAFAAALPPAPPSPLSMTPPPPSPLPTAGAGGLLAGRFPIRVVPVTATLVGQHVRQFELTGDGSVWADGRKVAAISGSEVRNLRGDMLFWVRADGAFVDRFGRTQVRFSGDDLVEGRNRFLVAPGGRILSVLPAGSEIAGQVIRGARCKRTVLVALFAALAAR
jgi:hypothetical protein